MYAWNIPINNWWSLNERLMLTYPSKYSKVSAKTQAKPLKMQWSGLVAKYFLFNCFPGWLSMAVPDNRKQ